MNTPEETEKANSQAEVVSTPEHAPGCPQAIQTEPSNFHHQRPVIVHAERRISFFEMHILLQIFFILLAIPVCCVLLIISVPLVLAAFCLIVLLFALAIAILFNPITLVLLLIGSFIYIIVTTTSNSPSSRHNANQDIV